MKTKEKEIKITFPDGSSRQFPSGSTGIDIARAISPRLGKEALAVRVNGHIRDIGAPLSEDGPIEILTFESPDGKKIFWHSSSHIMAQAVLELFPGAKLAIGPPIEEGFYYDFEVDQPFSPEDLERIEKRMAEIIKEDAAFHREEISRRDILKKYREEKADYKVEILEEDIPDETVTVYKHSRFADLCRGPHIPRTGIIKAYKLTTSSGAYWRGDEHNKMLQRIYGVSYPKKKMLDEYLTRMEEAKKRDHRILGKQLELFHITNEVGAGLVLWLPKGSLIRNELENYWRETHLANGYQLVYSPHIAHLDLWNRSGHTDFYRENMFQPMEIDQVKYQIKPMNCPFHMMMYKSRRWSYRDLPMRWAELGTVYRYEMPGVLHGLLRVRGFTQDDAHHFVAPEAMEDELVWLVKFCLDFLEPFAFTAFDIYLSTRPEKAIGDPKDWEKAENGLRRALETLELDYEVDEGGGAFYGPKIDIKIKDAMGRSWQCSTIQFDFSLPERFDMTFTDRDGAMKRPFIIHRALMGAVERFFGVLVEHYGGRFPLWMAPVQAKILPITDTQNEYGEQVLGILKNNGIRAELDDRSEKIGHKIRESELQKVPYMLIIGGREAEKNEISVRLHGKGDKGSLPLDKLMEIMKKEIRDKKVEPELD